MKKILLAEDDPFIIDIYTTKLKQANLEVEVVNEGDEVLEKARKQKPDLLLLDIVLPTMNGWEILRAIRESEDLKDLPVVILSNLYQKDEVEKGMIETTQKEYGTAKLLKNLPFVVAGKTGSAQVSMKQKTNAFFTGYGPVGEEKKIVILVLIEDAREGGSNSVPVAYDVFRWYYENRISK
ncbi:MAG: Response regulator receiver protein [Candidatus Wolfebacteria bacterium GW2011_GWA2_47_9b]|uniref:Response regulator receiver protein n=1 Tax=Candidatus Wolfebacteria bacterium GW2011_GWA2_47_9b TaxID=1619005 RepID=A0A0G1U4V2_9BACT|nr:MAG: Response regulator receiver protein [Candidatus Wolfebacteria bacterium GW2011_GWA2_47_9b]